MSIERSALAIVSLAASIAALSVNFMPMVDALALSTNSGTAV
jgi:hypothetical protein